MIPISPYTSKFARVFRREISIPGNSTSCQLIFRNDILFETRSINLGNVETHCNFSTSSFSHHQKLRLTGCKCCTINLDAKWITGPKKSRISKLTWFILLSLLNFRTIVQANSCNKPTYASYIPNRSPKLLMVYGFFFFTWMTHDWCYHKHLKLASQ